MTASLECRELVKRYPGQHAAALGDDAGGVSLQVQQGELFALLGPSGCGKTTLLRLVGGFLKPDRGSILIGGKDVTGDPPYRRPTNTVFQSYALFPHLKLGANVAFGLQMHGVRGAQKRRRVDEALELVGLGGWSDRKVNELSGGQQQRAALARALVNRPEVLLLDEPLGALDLRLRRQMQEELVTLKEETGRTFVHVTHDQEEACAIANRIAVMNQGRIVQVDTPVSLYRSPRTTFVAEFIDVGTVLRGMVRRFGDVLELASPDVTLRGSAPTWLRGGEPLAAVVPHDRMRAVLRSAPDGGTSGLPGTVERVVFTGGLFDVFVRTPQGLEVRVCMPDGSLAGIVPGAPVTVTWRPEDVIFVEDDQMGSPPDQALVDHEAEFPLTTAK